MKVLSPLLVLAFAACSKAPPAPVIPTSSPAPMAYPLFDVTSAVPGRISVGEPVTLETVVTSRVPVSEAAITIAMPEVAAARASGWGSEYRMFGVGVRPPAIDSVVTAISPGNPVRRSSSVLLEAPGYYQVVVTAGSSGAMLEEDGVPLVSPQHHTFYIWTDEESGYTTRDFDPTRLPLGAEIRPGPLHVPAAATRQTVQLDSARLRPRTHGVVHGTVTDEQGTRAPNVRVQVRAYVGTCPGRGVAEEVVRTDASGMFQVSLRSWPDAPFTACVAVHADQGAQHGTARAQIGMSPMSAAPDSVYMEVRLSGSAH